MNCLVLAVTFATHWQIVIYRSRLLFGAALLSIANPETLSTWDSCSGSTSHSVCPDCLASTRVPSLCALPSPKPTFSYPDSLEL